MRSLAFWSFVATKVLLGFRKDDALAELRAVLLERELIRSIHSIFGRVINTLTSFFTDESNNLTLVSCFCHRL